MSSFEIPQQPDPNRPSESLPTPTGVPYGVTGPKADVVMSLMRALQDPALREALAVSFSEPIKTIRVTPSRDGSCEMKLRNGELEIIYQDRFRDRADALHSVVQQICSRAVIEVTFTALVTFISKGARDPFLFDKLKPFLEGALRSSVANRHEDLPTLINTIIESAPQLLIDRAERLSKKLKKAARPYTSTLTEATQKIDAAGALTSQLLALTFLIGTIAPSNLQAAQARALASSSVDLLPDIDSAMRRIALDVAGLWPRAVFDGNGHLIIALQQRMQRAFDTDGFQRLMARKLDYSTTAAISLLFRDEHSRLSPMRLQTLQTSMYDVRSMLAQRVATVRVDQELRNWTTSDPDRFGLLRERLLDLIPHAPSGLRDITHNFPAQLPEPLAEFIKAICLLRLHGGPDGLAHFSTLACPLTESEREEFTGILTARTDAQQKDNHQDLEAVQEQLSAFFAKRTEQHVSTYLILVEFLAKWPLCKNQEERAALSSTYKTYLTEVIASVLFTITKGIEESFQGAIDGGMRFAPETLTQFRSDIIGLAKAGTDLENSAVSEYITPVTTSLLDLLTIFDIQTLPMQERSQHLSTIRDILVREKKQLNDLTTPSRVARSAPGFTEMILSLSQQTFDEIEGPLKQELVGHTESITRAAKVGDVDSFAPVIKAALDKLPQYTHLDSYDAFVELINSVSLTWTNEIGTQLSQLVDAITEQLPRSTDWNSTLAEILPSVRWHLQLSHDLRDAFSARHFPSTALRVNHINAMVDSIHKRISTALLSNEEMLLRCVTFLTERLQSSADEGTLANVRILLAAPILPHRFSSKQTRDAYTRLREALAQYRD